MGLRGWGGAKGVGRGRDKVFFQIYQRVLTTLPRPVPKAMTWCIQSQVTNGQHCGNFYKRRKLFLIFKQPLLLTFNFDIHLQPPGPGGVVHRPNPLSVIQSDVPQTNCSHFTLHKGQSCEMEAGRGLGGLVGQPLHLAEGGRQRSGMRLDVI